MSEVNLIDWPTLIAFACALIGLCGLVMFPVDDEGAFRG